MQVYRKAARSDDTMFGTEAAYLMRVFKWSDDARAFLPDILRNQIERSRVTCSDPTADCTQARKRRDALVAFLMRKDTLSSIDKGTLEVDYGLSALTKQGVSVSPGGSHRSANQPYRKANDTAQDVMTDKEIDQALADASRNNIKFTFVKSAEDVRTRLNESSCSGCHQTRAIAGFHFPGADKKETAAVNSVLLPGSPHFYGDQPRRMEIPRKMAGQKNTRLTESELALSYSARPMEKFAEQLSSTQLVGGWGAVCLTGPVRNSSQRQWDCRSGLACRQIFESASDPGIGTCVPDARFEIGDALQEDRVKSLRFGIDRYVRRSPVSPDQRIPGTALPRPAPAGNSYYGAHQEFYLGDSDSTDRTVRRDASTGGFPGGMLRLSECINLPIESTCGLIASSGFNTCISRIRNDPAYSVDTRFRHFTSYAGVRACDRSSPCRDDYICVKPIEYAVGDAERRKSLISSSPYFRQINQRDFDPDDFGQRTPDDAWRLRNDHRGLCIPPYFVFQFRSDGHPAPPRMQ